MELNGNERKLRERQLYVEETERLKQLHAPQCLTYKVMFCFQTEITTIKMFHEISIFPNCSKSWINR